MSDPAPKRRDLGRADRVMPGVWRLRLPITPWPGVPHVNAYAITAGSGVVLIDTGLYEPGGLSQLERALGQAGLKLEHIRLLVCTHAHTDHYGMAGPIVDAAGCELWMHPNHSHMTKSFADPERALERRLEVARQSGVPAPAVEAYREARKGAPTGIERIVEPDRELVEGVEVDTDLGPLQVYETPGHAPSHVCLHQPDSRIMFSGDHLLGRVSIFYDMGHSPDPASEFLSSLDKVEKLGAGLCLSGHGKPFRDVQAHIDANRKAVHQGIERTLAAIATEPRTAFEVVPDLVGKAPGELAPMAATWALSDAICYLRHLELGGKVERLEGEESDHWRAI